ncbi:MAG TPA: hypothetical protein DEG17_03350 [Cyanobacteria bacterium UBA11149]|nr:hypothetical protein [Cyanobacteria bacterium UBA11367]HBE61057.1 hypothetical protein [Cyanobacteria bacterium UBA11366]HBK62280.1 hypothetical protein [Cyanobacteria bacterium UBA11166]HBR74242.1 hypothetical protein [Cyanobacteria bacterium UBA11159]HBS69861.1 hypothetical protein [Cyanobacteria bacterium UBA11153]HBW87943.1 hypothetical protein [Cyanobacteria bacterium UBA11149]HCA95025.1 hypothetical protein [Cyanobacteria bacterium UBA9226]
MPFNPTEQFQNTVRQSMNPIINEYFRDTEGENLKSSRGALKISCLHRENDSLCLTQARMDWFRDIRGYGIESWVLGADREFAANERPDLINLKVDNHPKITIKFAQDLESTPEGKQPVRMSLSFRIMDKVIDSSKGGDDFTPLDAEHLAKKIKSAFATPKYTHSKGKELWLYKDNDNGYDFRILSLNKGESEKLIKTTLAIRNIPYQQELLRLSDYVNKKSVSTTNSTTRIYGETRQDPRYRPVANVRFRWALAYVGLNRQVCLCDTTGFFRDALEVA